MVDGDGPYDASREQEMNSSSPYSGTDHLETLREARRYNAFLVELVNSRAPTQGRILDFGAGIGTHTCELAVPGRELVCVEVDADFRATLSAEGFETHAALESIGDGSCDFVYSLNVLEHIEDDQAAVQALYRVLKSGGSALIYVPAMQVLFSAMDEKVGHYRRYDRRGLRAILEKAGFCVNVVQYADSIGFFATIAYKLFGSSDGSLNRRGLIIYDRFVFPLSLVLDTICRSFVGKNLFAIVYKPPCQGMETKAELDARVPWR